MEANRTSSWSLEPLAIQPGIVRDTNRYANKGGWYDCDMVRFRNGKPESIGGWTQYTNSAFTGTCRSLHRWADLGGKIQMGIGTSNHFYIEIGGDITDITPIRKTSSSLSDPLTTSSGTSTVTVTDTNHKAAIGDYVIISGATGFNGISAGAFNTEHLVVSTPTANTFTIEVSETASGSGAGGGTVTIKYLYTSGLNEAVPGTGWSAGSWGESGWGQSIDSSSAIGLGTLRVWSQDNFGEDLLFCPRYGDIFFWDSSVGTGTRAVYLKDEGGATNVPVLAICMLVSERDRHVMAFGCNAIGSSAQDPLLVRWSDQEDKLVWTPDSSTTAGDLRLGVGSKIITAKQTRQEILVWTDRSLHAIRYIGGDFIFGEELLSGHTTIAGFNAAAVVDDVTYWMGRRAFYVYDGRVREIECPIRDYIFDNLNASQLDVVCAGTNVSKSEIIWFYPATGSTTINRYVIYNYQDDIWYYGTLARTAWWDVVLSDNPLAASSDGYIYAHEDGEEDGSTMPGTAIASYIESSPIEIGNGYQFAFLNRLIPDFSFDGSSAANPVVSVTLKAQSWPGGEVFGDQTKTVTRTATTPVDQFTTHCDISLRGRSFVYRVDNTTLGVAWRMGTPRIQIRTDGRKH